MGRPQRRKDTAGAVKKGVTHLALLPCCPDYPKYGKDIVGIAKNIVLRK